MITQHASETLKPLAPQTTQRVNEPGISQSAGVNLFPTHPH